MASVLEKLSYRVRQGRVFYNRDIPLGDLVDNIVDTGPISYEEIEPTLFEALNMIMEKDNVRLYRGIDPDGGHPYFGLRAIVDEKSILKLVIWRGKLLSPHLREKAVEILGKHKKEIESAYQQTAKLLVEELEAELL